MLYYNLLLLFFGYKPKEMKKLILLSTFILLSVVGLNAQNDFRKMNWGESFEVLVEKYPEVDFEKETVMGMTAYSHIGYVSGLETRIAYSFIKDEFVAGFYQFTPQRSSYHTKDFVKDFENISEKLQAKYEMERNDIWYNDKNIDVDYFGIDYYLRDGDVDLKEIGFNEGTMIAHTLEKSEGTISHMLIYAGVKYFESREDSDLDDL